MDSFEHIRTMMSELGPMLKLAEVTEFSEEATWLLIVNEDTTLVADYDADEDRLYLSADVAAPPAEQRLEIYETLLQYNLGFRETGGMRMSLDGPGGTVVQSCDLLAHGLELDTLLTVVTNFTEKLFLWREQVRSGIVSDSSNDDKPFDPNDPKHRGTMIRA